MATNTKKDQIDATFISLVMPDAKAQFIMQPNKVTNASMSYNKRQMDALILILSRMQSAIREQLERRVQVEQLNLFQQDDLFYLRFEIPIRDFGVTPQKYELLKQDLASMAVIPILFKTVDPITQQRESIVGGFYTAHIPERYGRTITIDIHKDIAKHFVDITGGFTRYNQSLALNLKSSHAKRLYMFISSWKNKEGVTVSMDGFREILNIVDKYPNYKDLYKRVIQPCYETLKEKADCWFEITPQYREGEKQPHQLVFKIISRPQTAIEIKRLNDQKNVVRHYLFLLGMSSGHIETICEQVHPGNVVSITQKVCDLHETCFERSIENRDAYYFKAMQQFITGK